MNIISIDCKLVSSITLIFFEVLFNKLKCTRRQDQLTPINIENKELEQVKSFTYLGSIINPLNPELNPICYLLALLAHHFLHVSRIRVKSLTIRLLMSYI